MCAALRIEWAWSLLRKERWEEEVVHLQEEMRRFLMSANYCLEKWITRSTARPDVTPELHSGLHAYAYSQAYIIASQAVRASSFWDASDSSASLIPHSITHLLRNIDLGSSAISTSGPEVPDNVDDPEDESLGMHENLDDGYLSE